MIATFKRYAALLSLLAVAACGGGGGSAGTSTFGNGSNGTPPTAAVSDLVLVLSAETITNSSTANVQVTVTALDANRNAVPNAAVTLAADKGAVVTVTTTPAVTDASGRLQATVGIGSDRTTRVLTVTATSGSITRTGQLSVVTAPGSATPSTIEILASSISVGTGGEQATVRAVVKDASNNALAGVPVAYSATSGTLSNVSGVTDAAGVSTATFAAGSNKANRNAVVTVSAGAITGAVTLTISGTKLSYSGPTTLQFAGVAALSVKAVDSAGAPIPGVSLAVSSSLGNTLVPTTVTTDAGGNALVSYTAIKAGADTVTFSGSNAVATAALAVSGEDFSIVAPASNAKVPINTDVAVSARYLVAGVPGSGAYAVRFSSTLGSVIPAAAEVGGLPLTAGTASANVRSSNAGPATLQATLVNTSTGLVVARASVPVQFIATVPAALVLQITPTSVGPNSAGVSDRQAQARATVTDAAGNPVEGTTVNFTKVVDPSGGRLSQASAVTDASGQAAVQYIAGAGTTASDGVQLKGTVAGTAVSGTATLTVNQNALFIALGTGNTITNLNETTYEKVWTVYVTDSSGAAVPNQLVTVSVLPTRYRKGSFVLVGEDYVYGPYTGGVRADGDMPDGSYVTCNNEDTNYTGVYTSAADVNNNKRLDPGNVISVNGGTSVTTVTTDSNGFALLRLRYAESYAFWVEVKLRANATVAGTESSNEARFFAPGLNTDYTKAGGPPAGLRSPFGQKLSPEPVCTVAG